MASEAGSTPPPAGSGLHDSCERRGRELGAALIAVYLVLAVMMALGMVLVLVPLAESRAAERNLRLTQTLYLAEGGVDLAVASLRGLVFQADVLAGGAEVSQVLEEGEFVARVDFIPETGVYRIESTGHYPSQDDTAPWYQTRSVVAYAQLAAGGTIPPGLFGEEGIDIRGSVTVNSYDSSVSTSPIPTFNGQMKSNGTASATIDINGSVEVYGDLLSGPGSEADAIQITGASLVTGEQGPAKEETTLSEVDEEAGEEDKQVSSSETWEGGTYRFESLTVTGGAELSFTGPTKIYVEELTLSGGSSVNPNGVPDDLHIYVVEGGDVQMTGNASFYGVLYAPDSEVRMNGSFSLYGAVVGQTIDARGSVAVWADDALQGSDAGAFANIVTLHSWSEP